MRKVLSFVLCAALLLSVLPSRAAAVAETLTDPYTAGEGSFALTEQARLFLIAEETPSEEILTPSVCSARSSPQRASRAKRRCRSSGATRSTRRKRISSLS